MTKEKAKRGSKLTDAEQSKRFMKTAKEVGADQDANALERAFKRISSAPKKLETKSRP